MYGIGTSCSAANTVFASWAVVVIAAPPSAPQSSPRRPPRPRGCANLRRDRDTRLAPVCPTAVEAHLERDHDVAVGVRPRSALATVHSRRDRTAHERKLRRGRLAGRHSPADPLRRPPPLGLVAGVGAL